MTSATSSILNQARSSVAIKAPCRVATTANITLSGEQVIDGVAVVSGDRVLVKNQTTGANNGIFICDTGDWQRSPDAGGTRDLVTGTLIYVRAGTVGPGFYYLTTTGTITVGTTALTFAGASTVLATVSAFIQTLLDDPTAAAARSTLIAAGSATLISAAGLATGGGDLSVDRTITVTAATQTQQEAGSSGAVAVTPAVQHHHPSAAKAWIVASTAGTVAIGYNVDAPTDVATGQVAINFTTDFSSSVYPVIGQGLLAAGGAAATTYTTDTSGPVAGSVTLTNLRVSDGTPVDPTQWNCIAFGDHA